MIGQDQIGGVAAVSDVFRWEPDFKAYLHHKCAVLRRSRRQNSRRYPAELWLSEHLLEVAEAKPLSYIQALTAFANEAVSKRPSPVAAVRRLTRTRAPLDSLASYASVIASFPSREQLLDQLPNQEGVADGVPDEQADPTVIAWRQLIFAKRPAVARIRCTAGTFPEINVRIQTDPIAYDGSGRAERDSLWDDFADELGASASKVQWRGNLQQCEARWTYRRCHAAAIMDVNGMLQLTVELVPRGASPAARAWFEELDRAGDGR